MSTAAKAMIVWGIIQMTLGGITWFIGSNHAGGLWAALEDAGRWSIVVGGLVGLVGLSLGMVQ